MGFFVPCNVVILVNTLELFTNARNSDSVQHLTLYSEGKVFKVSRIFLPTHKFGTIGFTVFHM